MGVQGRRTDAATIRRIIDLRAKGVSWRRTARECGVSSEIVGKYAPRAVVEARRKELRAEAERRGEAFLLVLSGRRDQRERERDREQRRLAGEGLEPNASPSPPTSPAPPASQAKPTAESTAHPWRKFAK